MHLNGKLTTSSTALGPSPHHPAEDYMLQEEEGVVGPDQPNTPWGLLQLLLPTSLGQEAGTPAQHCHSKQ